MERIEIVNIKRIVEKKVGIDGYIYGILLLVEVLVFGDGRFTLNSFCF